VQTSDDEKFEMHLKRFAPIAPAPLPALRFGYESRRSFRLTAWVTALAPILFVIGTAILHNRGGQMVPNTAQRVTSAGGGELLGPLTMRRANTWLATTPSFKAAIDDMAFRSQSESIPNGQQSAMAVLSKEKIKL
jgi:hypothetical protein